MLKLQDGQCCETAAHRPCECVEIWPKHSLDGNRKPDVTSAPERSRIPGEMQAHRSLMLLAR
jgi:hypothetical protein